MRPLAASQTLFWPVMVPTLARGSGAGDVGAFVGGEIGAQKEGDVAEDFRDADLVIPPVRALVIVLFPVGKGLVDGGEGAGGVISRSAGAAGVNDEAQRAGEVGGRWPGGAGLGGVVDVGPGAVRFKEGEEFGGLLGRGLGEFDIVEEAGAFVGGFVKAVFAELAGDLLGGGFGAGRE